MKVVVQKKIILEAKFCTKFPSILKNGVFARGQETTFYVTCEIGEIKGGTIRFDNTGKSLKLANFTNLQISQISKFYKSPKFTIFFDSFFRNFLDILDLEISNFVKLINP